MFTKFGKVGIKLCNFQIPILQKFLLKMPTVNGTIYITSRKLVQ